MLESAFIFFPQYLTERLVVQVKSQKKLYNITLTFDSGMTRSVKVKAVSRSAAEERALKFHPRAKGVKRDA